MQEISFAEAIRNGIRDEMANNERVFVMGEDVGILGGRKGATKGLLQEFGSQRVIDMPLNEELILGIALGAAQEGLVPIVEYMYSNFLLLALSDLYRIGSWRSVNGGKISLPIVVRAPYGSYNSQGPDLSGDFLSVFYTIPGLKIVIPSTPEDAYNFVKAAIKDSDPVLFLEHDNLYKFRGTVQEKKVNLCTEPDILQEGSDCSVISYGYTTALTQQAIQSLNKKIELLNLTVIKPFSAEAILKSAQKTKKVLLMEEGVVGGTFTSAIIKMIRETDSTIKIKQLGAKDIPLPFGTLAEKTLPSVDDIKKAILELCA